MTLLAGERPALPAERSSDGLLLGVSVDEFGLSADIVSGSLGPTSLVSDNAMFSSATAAPLPLHPIGPGLSDSPSMTAYIATGSPASDTTSSQLIWKQSANLPDPELLQHMYGAIFLAHASNPEFTLSSQGRDILHLSSPCEPAFTSIYVPFVSASLLLFGGTPLIRQIYSNLSLPQTHPKYPRAAVLHAICAVATIYTPTVSTPRLYGARGEAGS